MVKDRYSYLDIAKGIGILMVVWAHIMLVGWSHKVCYAFHMPLFFFVSGMLFDRNKYAGFSSFIGKRSRRLLLPYVIYSVITWAIWAAFRFIRHDAVDSYIAPLLQTIIAQGSGAFLVHNSALWFIPCLFVVEVMYYFISKLPEWLNVAVCIAMCALSFVLGHYLHNGWWLTPPFNFDAALIALPFYSIGNMLIKYWPHDKLIDWAGSHKIETIVFWAISSVAVILLALKFGECSMGSSSYICSGAIFMVRAFVGIFSLLAFSLLISPLNLNLTKWFGRDSLDIMCLHIPVKGVVILVIAIILGKNSDYVSSHWLPAILVFIVTMLTVSILVQFINRYIRKQR